MCFQGSECEGEGGERLDLSGNGLRRVPQGVSERWEGAKEVDLSSNRLEPLSGLEPLSSLHFLTSLSLRHNSLPSLPPLVPTIKSLVHLDLSDNNIAQLSPHIAHLPW
jgi:Leucine-rich repeat (LRR) protein